jgi:hypothetical protein
MMVRIAYFLGMYTNSNHVDDSPYYCCKGVDNYLNKGGLTV